MTESKHLKLIDVVLTEDEDETWKDWFLSRRSRAEADALAEAEEFVESSSGSRDAGNEQSNRCAALTEAFGLYKRLKSGRANTTALGATLSVALSVGKFVYTAWSADKATPTRVAQTIINTPQNPLLWALLGGSVALTLHSELRWYAFDRKHSADAYYRAQLEAVRLSRPEKRKRKSRRKRRGRLATIVESEEHS